MKTIKYITIILFAIVAVLWGLLLGGCNLPQHECRIAFECKDLQDSFQANYHKEILSDPKCKRDSGFYYRGRADAYLELTNKLPK
jgi:hypothetical protein